MNPKMTVLDAAVCLKKNKGWILSTLEERQLPFMKANQQIYFSHDTAKALFQFSFKPQLIVFQIVKGGTGKTSLVYEFAVRSSLYGAKVLCIDMDQQGNLTHAFQQDAEVVPVMIDVLADNHPLEQAIIPVMPGIDLVPSRFENSLLDEVLRQKKLPLGSVYRAPWQALKGQYDLIVVDCPPSLGQSVAASALAADCLLAPVTPEKFALSGLDIVYQSVEELQSCFGVSIDFRIVLNKFEARTTLSQNALRYLLNHPDYESKLLKHYIRLSQEFPKGIANGNSIFESLKPTSAKEDLDKLTQVLLGISGGTSQSGSLDARRLTKSSAKIPSHSL